MTAEVEARALARRVAEAMRAADAAAAGAEISFLRQSRLGDELVARAELRSAAGRSGVYDVTIRAGEAVVAEFRGRSRAVPSLPHPPGFRP
jgi:acyl-CoA thioesterase